MYSSVLFFSTANGNLVPRIWQPLENLSLVLSPRPRKFRSCFVSFSFCCAADATDLHIFIHSFLSQDFPVFPFMFVKSTQDSSHPRYEESSLLESSWHVLLFSNKMFYVRLLHIFMMNPPTFDFPLPFVLLVDTSMRIRCQSTLM